MLTRINSYCLWQSENLGHVVEMRHLVVKGQGRLSCTRVCQVLHELKMKLQKVLQNDYLMLRSLYIMFITSNLLIRQYVLCPQLILSILLKSYQIHKSISEILQMRIMSLRHAQKPDLKNTCTPHLEIQYSKLPGGDRSEVVRGMSAFYLKRIGGHILNC